jgi:hypothetical protein
MAAGGKRNKRPPDDDDVIRVRVSPFRIATAIPMIAGALCVLALLPWILAAPAPIADFGRRAGWTIGVAALVAFPIYLFGLPLAIKAINGRLDRPANYGLRQAFYFGGFVTFAAAFAAALWLMLAPSLASP